MKEAKEEYWKRMELIEKYALARTRITAKAMILLGFFLFLLAITYLYIVANRC